MTLTDPDTTSPASPSLPHGTAWWPAYCAATTATAIYPQAGTGKLGALTYVALGLAGESSEVLEKVLDAAPDAAVAAELGDTLWFAARLHVELTAAGAPGSSASASGPATQLDSETGVSVLGAGADASGLPNAADLVVAAGRVANTASKALRDDSGTLSDTRLSALAAQLSDVLTAWQGAHASYGLSAHRTAQANLDKLFSRRDRGVLQGDGDTR